MRLLRIIRAPHRFICRADYNAQVYCRIIRRAGQFATPLGRRTGRFIFAQSLPGLNSGSGRRRRLRRHYIRHRFIRQAANIALFIAYSAHSAPGNFRALRRGAPAIFAARLSPPGAFHCHCSARPYAPSRWRDIATFPLASQLQQFPGCCAGPLPQASARVYIAAGQVIIAAPGVSPGVIAAARIIKRASHSSQVSAPTTYLPLPFRYYRLCFNYTPLFITINLPFAPLRR